MPALNFLNRNKNNDNSSSNNTAANDDKASAMNTAALLHLPPEECRRVVRDRVMMAGAAVYIRHGVNASMALDDDPDLSKDAKAKKRDEQYAAHQAYKDRLHSLLGNETLLPMISTCLLLNNDDNSKNESSPAATETSSSLTNSKNMPLHDAFACVVLLLCNIVLLAASGGNTKNSQGNKGGYDARIRNVVRISSIELLAEALEREDTGGSFLKRLEEKKQSRPKISRLDSAHGSNNGDEGEEEVSFLNNIESPVSDEGSKDSEQKDDNENMDAITTSSQEDEALPDEDPDPNSKVYANLYRRYATRKYHALEEAVATLMMNEMVNGGASSSEKKKADSTTTDDEEEATTKSGNRFSRKQMVRAAKIGGVSVVAGTLFAVTGGLAAPGIAAGLAALGVGGTALTLAASPAALIALFGVGGGGLSAYKMKRRTDGLSEFIIRQETTNTTIGDSSAASATDDTLNSIAHLHTTVCISGWLNDEHDFQRPWGVMASSLSRLERLQRFFSVVEPQKLQYAKEMVKPYSEGNTEEDVAKDEELWQAFSAALKEQYGKSPDELLPLKDRAIKLSVEEDVTLKEIFHAILPVDTPSANDQPSSSTTSQIKTSTITLPVLPEEGQLGNESLDLSQSPENDKVKFRVWDYQTEYGGDLYTIQWESTVLLKMCKVANNMVKELASKAGVEVLKKTVMATIMAAVALPSLLVGLAGSLDNDWTLITIRSDLAGVELARSLLQSNEQRPVNLVGFSFGARVVYACLLELARHQAIWEEQQKDKKSGAFKNKFKKKDDKDSIEYTREPASIVQDALLIGAPLFISRSKLRLARHVVAGRFVNCYSRKDWILSLMFQYKNKDGFMRGMYGTGPVKGVGGIENYDVAGLVSSWHAHYCKAVPDILDFVGFDQPMSGEIS
jgi:hypothetical protein